MVLEYLKELVSLNTENPPGNERKAAEYVKDLLKHYGIESELQIVEDNRANLIAWIGPADGRTIILTGHLDVVPAGDGWQTDPFRLVCKDGIGYGRGVSDMKGGIASMISALVQVKKSVTLSHTRVMLVLVCDEEIHGKGTRAFLEQYQLPEDSMVIIGEPTSMEIQIAHRGVTRFRLTVHGVQAHSAFPQQGSNAIFAMGRLLAGVEEWHRRRQACSSPHLPPPTASCTMIRGGIKDNVIPAEASCIIDCRTIPGDRSENLKEELCKILDQIPLPDGCSYTVEPFLEMPPGITEESCETVTLAREVWTDFFGTEPIIKDFPACSDMPQFTSRGFETILWGPGSIKEAHSIDERVQLQEIYKMTELYQRFIERVEQQRR